MGQQRQLVYETPKIHDFGSIARHTFTGGSVFPGLSAGGAVSPLSAPSGPSISISPPSTPSPPSGWKGDEEEEKDKGRKK